MKCSLVFLKLRVCGQYGCYRASRTNRKQAELHLGKQSVRVTAKGVCIYILDGFPAPELLSNSRLKLLAAEPGRHMADLGVIDVDLVSCLRIRAASAIERVSISPVVVYMGRMLR